jgi:hypothetical protein
MPKLLPQPDPTPAECIAAALAYRGDFGWSVVAECPPDHHGMTANHVAKCNNPGKVPWHRWKQRQDELPTDAQIRELWRRNPQSNVGAALGPVSGLVRLDVDGQAGASALADASGGDVPATLEFTGGKDTSRGLLYAIPPGVVVRTTVKPIQLGAELRLQARGAQTVLPPSRHANGRVYKWAPGRSPWDMRAAPMPGWLMAAMAPAAPRPQTSSSVVNRCRRYLEAMPPSISGNNGHDACFDACLAIYRGFALDGAEADELVRWFNSTRCDPPWSAEELAHKVEGALNADRVGMGYLLDGDHRATGGAAGAGAAGDDRPKIVITTEEHQVNAEAVQALASDQTIYQRGGQLVRVVRDTSPAANGIRRPHAPRIDPLPQPILRERLAEAAQWITQKQTDNGVIDVPARPPAWSVSAVHARGEWQGIRHLEAVVDYPILRPDGSILYTPGYDPATGLLLEPTGPIPTTIERPSRADAVAARDMLLDLVTDFPFAYEIHKAGWCAGLLTPIARFAFTGPAPLFLCDSNVRGAGKGLLLNAIAKIVTGQVFTVATYTTDNDELRKRITSLAQEADRLVLFDNLDGNFGGPVLDAALTATSWKDRLLGGNRTVSAPMYMTWYATGNNVVMSADTWRRVCHIRLESPEEHPEERGDFHQPNLLDWVGEHRQELLAAALTILRGYVVAGRPDMKLPAWGSYEGWSALVRAAVVWVGLPDPGKTRVKLQDTADSSAQFMIVILDGLERMDPQRQGVTAAYVIETIKNEPFTYDDLRAAVEGLVGKLESQKLGYTLRSFRRRMFAGRYLDHAGKDHSAIRWAVYPAAEFGHRAGNPPQAPDPPPAGEDGE